MSREQTLPPNAHVLRELEGATYVYRAACSLCGWRGQGYTVEDTTMKHAADHKCHPFKSVAELVQEGVAFDGGHHKQWYLVQIARLLGIDIGEDYDKGIPA